MPKKTIINIYVGIEIHILGRYLFARLITIIFMNSFIARTKKKKNY